MITRTSAPRPRGIRKRNHVRGRKLASINRASHLRRRVFLSPCRSVEDHTIGFEQAGAEMGPGKVFHRPLAARCPQARAKGGIVVKAQERSSQCLRVVGRNDEPVYFVEHDVARFARDDLREAAPPLHKCTWRYLRPRSGERCTVALRLVFDPRTKPPATFEAGIFSEPRLHLVVHVPRGRVGIFHSESMPRLEKAFLLSAGLGRHEADAENCRSFCRAEAFNIHAR